MANYGVFLSNLIKISSYYNVSINFIKIFKSISNFFNIILLYYKSIDKFKTEKAIIIIDKTILSLSIILYFKILLATILIIIINLKFFN